MSNVIRKSSGFVPEKIIAIDVEQPAVWQDLAKPYHLEETESPEARRPPTSAREEGGESPADERPGREEPAFADDFSSPQDEPSGAQQGGEDPESQQAPQVDLEALAEEYFNKGVQAGMERVESDYKLSVRTLQAACQELDTIRETILQNSLQEMRDLVLAIAEKIIRHSVARQDDTIIKTVEEAILQAVKSDEFIISVNPEDYQTIKSHSSDFINAVNGLENIIVKANSSVEQGGCVVESSNCTVDATLASQLEIIADAVKGG